MAAKHHATPVVVLTGPCTAAASPRAPMLTVGERGHRPLQAVSHVRVQPRHLQQPRLPRDHARLYRWCVQSRRSDGRAHTPIDDAHLRLLLRSPQARWSTRSTWPRRTLTTSHLNWSTSLSPTSASRAPPRARCLPVPVRCLTPAFTFAVPQRRPAPVVHLPAPARNLPSGRQCFVRRRPCTAVCARGETKQRVVLWSSRTWTR